MFKPTRLQLMKWHALLACFFLPIALLFFISGALYFLDIKGKSHKQVFSVSLEHPFSPNLEELTHIATNTLIDNNIALPNGSPRLIKKKKKYIFIWRDLKYTVKLTTTKKTDVVKITLHERNLLAQIMTMHTANGGEVFKILAVLMVIALTLILSTGIFMAHASPALRKPAWLALLLGSIGIVILMAIS